MKSLLSASSKVFNDMIAVLEQLNDTEYAAPLAVLNNATIGKHTRHIIDMYLCLAKGYEAGTVSYDHRERNMVIETDAMIAQEFLVKILSDLDRADKPLALTADYDLHVANSLSIHTTYYRELVYTLEHSIHHIAMINIALKSFESIAVPAHFGVAVSTIKHHQ